MKNILLTVLMSLVLMSQYRCRQDANALPKLVDFNFDVKPILVQNCYLCHGPDSTARKGGLRLDTFLGATDTLKEGGHAIVPGHIEDSKLIDRINDQDPEKMMPPPDSKFKLTKRDIAILTKWIDQGAQWKPHWAFMSPLAPNLDKLKKGQNEIDYFIDKSLKNASLHPTHQASKNSLIRRVSYILTGLPPATESIEKYLADDSPDAYEKMVAQYLHSIHFGEKWARHWMDIVRYAETKGHEFDYKIAGAWRYRDYLIKAFNDDLPFPQFVKEQLAGDLLSSVRRDSVTGQNESHIGTLFYAFSEGSHSPVDVRKDESDRIDNMIDVTSKAFQGLTVSCARCHDHKFDPIATKEYYALYGIMESSRFSPVPAIRTLKQEESIKKNNELKVYIRKIIADQWKTEMSNENKKSDSKKNAVDERGDKIAANLFVIGDFRGSDLQGWKSDGIAFGQHTTLGSPLFNEKNELIGLEEGKASSRYYDHGIFGALRSPNFKIDQGFIGVRARGLKSSIRIIIDNFQLISYPIYGELDQKVDNEGWQNFLFDVTLWKNHKAYIEILPGRFEQHVYKTSTQAYVEIQYAIAFDGKWLEPALTHDQHPGTTLTAINNWAEFTATSDQISRLNLMLRSHLLSNKFSQVSQLMTDTVLLTNKIYDTVFFNGLYDGIAINSPVFIRGNQYNLTSPVPRKFLSVLPSVDSVFQSRGSGRMELAETILNPDNPLTARVMVNRIWHYLFGKGIVETTDNFGLQGKLPSHPELLDFLALKFQQEGWSTKKMVKYILMSETFRRDVKESNESNKLDPDNLFLSHFPMRRLDAEDIRDGILSVSGWIDTLMYGEPVALYITPFMQGRGRPNKSGPLDGEGRRSIYQEVRRNFLEPMMLTFDRPVPFTTFGNRNISNVPAQSLILLNDPFVIQQAEEMACWIIDSDLNFEERVETIYYRAFARKPSTSEIDQAKSFLFSLAQMHKVPDKDILLDLKVWKDYCHSIFNIKEFIYLI